MADSILFSNLLLQYPAGCFGLNAESRGFGGYHTYIITFWCLKQILTYLLRKQRALKTTMDSTSGGGVRDQKKFSFNQGIMFRIYVLIHILGIKTYH